MQWRFQVKRELLSRDAGKSELTRMASASETVDRAGFMLKAIARPRWIETRDAALSKAARALGISRSQARRIVYGEVRSIPAHIWLRINELYEAECLRAEQAADLMELKARERRARLESDDAAVLEPAPQVSGMGSELADGDDRTDQSPEAND